MNVASFISGACVLCLIVSTCTAVTNTGTCISEGTVYKDGDNFTASFSGPCIVYQCIGGMVRIHSEACNWNGQCMAINQTWTEQCLTYQCQEINGAFGVKIIKGGCIVAGTCLGVNQTFTQGCFTYTCKQENHRVGSTFSLLLKEWGCSFGGKCVPANYTITHNCVTQKCAERSGRVGMYDLSQACMTTDNKCIKVGDSFVEKCRTFKCSQQELLRVKIFSLDPISAFCEDADGKCHGDGEIFSMRFNTDIYNNCSCSVSGMNPHYKCENH